PRGAQAPGGARPPLRRPGGAAEPLARRRAAVSGARRQQASTKKEAAISRLPRGPNVLPVSSVGFFSRSRSTTLGIAAIEAGHAAVHHDHGRGAAAGAQLRPFGKMRLGEGIGLLGTRLVL